MPSIAVFALVVATVAIVAVIAERRRRPNPVRTGSSVPDQLSRDDFDDPDRPWLVVLFSSSSCASCERARLAVESVRSELVAVQEAELLSARDLHDRYAIDAVPTVVIADAHGVVRAHFLGPPTVEQLEEALGQISEPGAVPFPSRDRRR